MHLPLMITIEREKSDLTGLSEKKFPGGNLTKG